VTKIFLVLPFVYKSLGPIGILIVHKFGREIGRLGYWMYTIIWDYECQSGCDT